MIEILVNTRERLYMGMVAQRACGGKNTVNIALVLDLWLVTYLEE